MFRRLFGKLFAGGFLPGSGGVFKKVSNFGGRNFILLIINIL